MTRLACALLLMSLGACNGGGFSGLPKAPPECEAQAYNDPAVKEIIVKRTSGNAELNIDLTKPLNDAVSAAIQRCLQQKGLAPRGGVERVRQ